MRTSFTITFFSKFNFLILLLALQCSQIIGQNTDIYSIKTVVIDAGHGGQDPGALGKVTKEKDITLKLALKVGNFIEKNFSDVKVIYTRNQDVFIPLDERSKIANDANADLFISIHCNSTKSKTPYGTETYVMGLSKSDANLDVAMRENAVITFEENYSVKYEGYDPNSAESFIIFSLLQNAFLDQSLNLANLIQTDFRDRLNRKDRGVKQERFLVLWKTSMPSVLVEVGYLSHPKEEIFLNSTEGQEYIASSIYRAFKEYKRNVDERNSRTSQNHFNHSMQNNVEKQTIERNEANEIQKNSNSSIIFKVQILASSKKLLPNSEQLKNLDNVEEIQSNGIYKYCIGSMQSYNEILTYCQEIKKIYPDAFIIALKEGNQIPVDMAIKEASNKSVQ
ncbi:N-acetylmuramoyl-L-alanine amidase [Tenuifilaceae bacterium CYCD]|nr:N-acetylmuramoyl-L-alanine amidase [Tenuifilaceae bacterium CYCD]